MPGFVIHLAVAYEYLKNYDKEISNKKNFFEGILAPDFQKNKMISHYGNYGISHIGLKKFLEVNDIDIKSDFGKGYILHLITDEAFYNDYFRNETEYIINKNIKFYNDYDCTNKKLIEYFKIEYIPKRAKEYIKIKDEEPKILEINKLIKFIKSLSTVPLQKQIESIKLNNKIIIDNKIIYE